MKRQVFAFKKELLQKHEDNVTIETLNQRIKEIIKGSDAQISSYNISLSIDYDYGENSPILYAYFNRWETEAELNIRIDKENKERIKKEQKSIKDKERRELKLQKDQELKNDPDYIAMLKLKEKLDAKYK